MTIYIDRDYKCRVNPAEGLTPAEVPFFDGKCTAFIEGHRFVPAGKSWTREDGKVFTGEMRAPWKSSEILAAYQAQHEATLAEMDAAYREGVNSV